MNCLILALICFANSSPVVSGPITLDSAKCLYGQSVDKTCAFVGFNSTGKNNENAYKNNVNLITAGFKKENTFVIFKVCATCGTIKGQFNTFLRSTSHMQFENIIFEIRRQYWYSAEVWNRMSFDNLINATYDYPKNKYILTSAEEWNNMFYLDYVVPHTDVYKLIYSTSGSSCSDKSDFVPFAGYSMNSYKYEEQQQTSCGTSYNTFC